MRGGVIRKVSVIIGSSAGVVVILVACGKEGWPRERERERSNK